MKIAMVLILTGAAIGGFGIWTVGAQGYSPNVTFMLRGLAVVLLFLGVGLVFKSTTGKDGEG